MANDLSAEKQQLHQLVDNLRPEQVGAALCYLNYLCVDPVLLSLLNAPPDDEPYTEEQRRQDAEAEASIARGEGVTHEEVLRDELRRLGRETATRILLVLTRYIETGEAVLSPLLRILRS